MRPQSIWKSSEHLKIEVQEPSWSLPSDLQRAVENYWQQLSDAGTPFFRGPVLSVEGIQASANQDEICVRWTDYAHFLYSRRFLQPHDVGYVRVLFAAGCLITPDHYWLVAEMNDATARPGWIQVVGGSPVPEDVVDGRFHPIRSVVREMREETGFDSENPESVVNLAVKGYTVDPVDMSIAVAVRVDLGMSAQDALDQFRGHRAVQAHPELAKLVALPTGLEGLRRLQQFGEPTVRYLSALLAAPELS